MGSTGNGRYGDQDIDSLLRAYVRHCEEQQISDFESFYKTHPQLAAELCRRFGQVVRDETTADFSLGPFSDSDAGSGASQSQPPTRYGTSRATSSGAEFTPGFRFGDYVIRSEVARGGMGNVYRALSLSLQRDVALKTIRQHGPGLTAEVYRFQQEARAAATLKHPNIVSVYETGQLQDYHYYTMEFVEGPTLQALLKDGPLDADEAARCLELVARGVHAAHEKGIIHRDIKPSNVLVEPDGQPRVTDFGIAKTVEGPAGVTRRGQIIGTPCYMSPEQAMAQEEIGPLSDVYSLGATLYTALTGRPPFQAGNEVDTLIQVRANEPLRPGLLNADVPPDLDTICLKCLEKDPGRRYPSALRLAEDLARFRAGESIEARPDGRIRRIARWSRRNRLLATVSALALTSGIVFLGLGFYYNKLLSNLVISLEVKNSVLGGSLRESQQLQHGLRQSLYISDMNIAGRAWQSGDIRQMDQVLSRHEHPGESGEYRGSEWYHLWEHCRVPFHRIWQHEQPVYIATLSADESKVATAGQDAVVRIFDRQSRQLLLEFETSQQEVNGIAFSPDGRQLASAGDDGTLRLWQLDWTTGIVQPGRIIQAHSDIAFNVAYINDGATLVSAGRDPVIRLWDVSSGEPAGALEGHDRAAGSFDVSPDGSRLASVGSDGDVVLWDLASLSEDRRIKPRRGRLSSVAWSADGERIVTGAIDRCLHVWDSRTGEQLVRLEHLDEIQTVLFAADGRSVISGDRAGTIRYWPLADDQDVAAQGPAAARAWRAHPGRIYRLARTKSGDELFSVGRDGQLLVWPFVQREPEIELRKPEEHLLDADFVGDSSDIVTVGTHSVDLWNAEDGRHCRRLADSTYELRCLDVSADGSLLAVGGESDEIMILEAGNDYHLRTVPTGSTSDIDQVSVSPDGRLIAAVARYGGTRDDLFVLNTETGERLSDIFVPDSNSAVFSADGRMVIASGPSNTLVAWHLESGRRIDAVEKHESPIRRISVSDDGRYVVTASDDRQVKVWEAQTLELLHELGSHRDRVNAAAFSRDRRTVASISADGVLVLTHVESGHELLQLRLGGDGTRVEFSSSDERLACVLNDGALSFVRIIPWR